MAEGFTDFWRYINRIRNQDKRDYATQYLEYLRAYRKTEPERGELSYMAAQAVRLNLHKLIGI